MVMRTNLRALLTLTILGCSTSTPPTAPDGGGSTIPDAPDAGSCVAPDVLVVLDRTMSMSRRPDGTMAPDTAAGHMETKWYIAVTAIQAVTARLGATVLFGLELFPRDPGGGVCVTLQQRLDGTGATNPTCEVGEIAVSPALATAPQISAVLDPETTLLCKSTPIGAALGTAQTELASIRDATRDQYVVFIGDGRDTCDEALALANADALATAGVTTFVVAFDGSEVGINNGLLNDLACAGQTASSFPTPCTIDADGHYRATDREGAALYLVAEDATALTTALDAISGEVCCGCLL
jgi:hypothetical protein